MGMLVLAWEGWDVAVVLVMPLLQEMTSNVASDCATTSYPSFLVCFALHLYGVFCSIAYRKLHWSSAPSWLAVGPYTNWPPWLTWSMR